MATLVAPDMVRLAFNGSMAGQDIVNILDVAVTDYGLGLSRDDAVFEMVGDALNNFADHVVPLLTDNYSFNSVSWVDLDSLDGSTGERTSTADTSLPLNGQDTGAPMPGGVALLVTKVNSGGRRTRNGRWYLSGIAEGVTDPSNPNTANAQFVTTANTALEAFRSGIEGIEEVGVNNYTSSPNVIHTVNGNYVGRDKITAFVVQPTLATQRRRQR